jgi:hypothetical protein
MSENILKTYKVLVPSVREQFEEWIRERGGVAVWENANLSNPSAGAMFTPLYTDGKLTPQPSWQTVSTPAVVTDIARFRFVLEMREMDRLRVATRVGSQGLSLKLTDLSAKRLRKRLDKAGDEAMYRFDFDTQEAVIEIPLWEEEKTS